MTAIECLEYGVSNDKISDIFIVAGRPLAVRMDGDVVDVESKKLNSYETDGLVRQLYDLARRDFSLLESERDDDFSISLVGKARFRVNTYYQRGSASAVIRVIKFGIPAAADINIPSDIISMSSWKSGLILVTGPAGSGKSTTLACIVDAINVSRKCHIITIEDPIEYLHRNKLSIVTQRELSMDTKNYHNALRACLRESPDVMLVGEMRDLETIRAVITAAETGHLVLSTLHTFGASNAVNRIVDVFPSDQQQQIRVGLSQVLRCVISQQLVNGANNSGILPAFEIMMANNAIKTLIREDRVHQIDSTIQTGRANGMISLDDYLLRLANDGKITKNEALAHSMNPEQLKKRM